MKKIFLFPIVLLFLQTPVSAQLNLFTDIVFEDSLFFRALVLKTTLANNFNDHIKPYNCQQLTSLDLGMLGSFGDKISSMPEIEYFTNLTSLIVSNNNLTELDLKKLTKLTYLKANSNNITSFDFSMNPEITKLKIYNNKYTTLDLTSLTKLKTIDLGRFYGSSIDFSQNLALTETFIQQTSVTSLDVSNNKNLENLFFITSDLTTVNIGVNSKLTKVSLQYNKLTSLDLTGVPNLTKVNVESNPNLSSVCVLSSHDTSTWKKGSNTVWDVNCDVLGLNKPSSNKIRIKQTLNSIIILEEVKKWEIVSLNGSTVLKGTKNVINISNLGIGLHILKITDGERYSTIKIVK